VQQFAVQPRRLLLRIPAALRRAGPRAGAAGLVLALLATGSAAAALPQPPGRTTLVSQKVGGGFPDGSSGAPSISSDGRYVAFASGASNLVRGDASGTTEVYVRDRSKGTTIRVPFPGRRPLVTDSAASEPSISADGSVVAFTYRFTFNNPNADGSITTSVVLAWSRKTGKTEIVSWAPLPNLSVAGAAQSTAIYPSREPSVSGNGRYIAYTTNAPIDRADGNGRDDIYRYDRQKRNWTLVSVGFQGRTPSGSSVQPSISDDGTKVAFSSDGGDSVLPQNTGPGLQVYLRDVRAKRTERISGGQGGAQGGAPANGSAEAPSISADGRYVAFESTAGNLAGAVGGAPSQVYRRDRKTGQTLLVSVDASGAPSKDGSGQPAISRDGRMVAFTSMTTNLVAEVPSVRLAAIAVKTGEVYIRDMTVGETALVSVGLSGGPAGARSIGPVVAGNGRFVAFYSNAQTLVDGDTGRTVDVFIRDFPPVPTLNPSVVDFGSHAAGTGTVPGAAVLTNAGWGLLSVSGVTIDGPAKGDYKTLADGCRNKTLHRGEACTVTIGFSPKKPGARIATLKVADGYTGSPRTARLSGQVALATLVLDSEIARPGLVVNATGSGFPPGAQVRLRWSRGISEDLPVVTADANGTFSQGVLVFHNDLLGERDLVAESAGGSAFPSVTAPMLVTEPPMGPPSFEILRLLMDLPLVLMIRG
jgi:Tol biopolymer transport system component